MTTHPSIGFPYAGGDPDLGCICELTWGDIQARACRLDEGDVRSLGRADDVSLENLNAVRHEDVTVRQACRRPETEANAESSVIASVSIGPIAPLGEGAMLECHPAAVQGATWCRLRDVGDSEHNKRGSIDRGSAPAVPRRRRHRRSLLFPHGQQCGIRLPPGPEVTRV